MIDGAPRVRALLVERHVEGELDVLGRDVGAVVPLGVLVEVECVGLAVGRDLLGVSQRRDDLAVDRADADQRLEDEAA